LLTQTRHCVLVVLGAAGMIAPKLILIMALKLSSAVMTWSSCFGQAAPAWRLESHAAGSEVDRGQTEIASLQ